MPRSSSSRRTSAPLFTLRAAPRDMSAAGAVAGRAEGLAHGRRRVPAQQPALAAHVAGDDDRLADVAVLGGDVGATRAEGPGRPFAVHPHGALDPVDHVRLALGDVVGHVVDELHAEALVACPEHLLKGAAHLVHHHLAVGEGEVAGAGHGRQVVPALRRGHRRAGELAVGQLEAEPVGRVHAGEVVGAGLVAEAARARVDHHHHLAGRDPEGGGRLAVEDLVDHLHLEEMVAGAQAADLRQAALQGLPADRVGVGARAWRRPPRCGRGPPRRPGRARPGTARPARPAGAARAGVSRSAPRAPVPWGTRRIELVQQLLESRGDVVPAQAGAHQPHAAVDVEADAARRDHALALVDGGHAADGKAVAPVDVGHGDAGLDDAGQRGDVGDLLQRLLVAGLVEELGRRVDDARHAHVALLGDLPRVLVETLDVEALPAARPWLTCGSFAWCRFEYPAGPACARPRLLSHPRRAALPAAPSDVEDDRRLPAVVEPPHREPVIGRRLDVEARPVALPVERLAASTRADT